MGALCRSRVGNVAALRLLCEGEQERETLRDYAMDLLYALARAVCTGIDTPAPSLLRRQMHAPPASEGALTRQVLARLNALPLERKPDGAI